MDNPNLGHIPMQRKVLDLNISQESIMYADLLKLESDVAFMQYMKADFIRIPGTVDWKSSKQSYHCKCLLQNLENNIDASSKAAWKLFGIREILSQRLGTGSSERRPRTLSKVDIIMFASVLNWAK
ncbi:hypothetical protein Tco_0482607 [Tanacetum coccineum]